MRLKEVLAYRSASPSGGRIEEMSIDGHRDVAPNHPMARKPGRRGRLIRNAAIAASVLNGLLVMSVIVLIAKLVPSSLPSANVVDGSTGDALAAGSASQVTAERGWAVAEDNSDSELRSSAEQFVAGLLDSIRVPAQRDQPATTEATSNWSAAVIEELLAAIEETNESSLPTRSGVAASRGATSLPPVEHASADSGPHPVAANSSILQKRPPTDQSASPDSGFPERLVEAPALGPEGRRPGAQAPDASSKSGDTGVRLIKSARSPLLIRLHQSSPTARRQPQLSRPATANSLPKTTLSPQTAARTGSRKRAVPAHSRTWMKSVSNRPPAG